MNVSTTPIEGLFLIEPKVFHDDRGYFFESFNARNFRDETGHEIEFVQDNQARSVKNVIRGLHYQNAPSPQTKLIRVLEGCIWDVAVDLRRESPTFGRWYGVEMSSDNKLQLLIPRGFAHGYSVLSDTAEIIYKCDNYYDKASESGIAYNDPALAIDWKLDLKDAIISEKDQKQALLRDAWIEFF